MSCSIFLCLLPALGCHDGGSAASRSGDSLRIATSQQVSERPLPMYAQSTLIKEGPPPLAYLAESAATLRIVDLSSGAELARALVRPRQILSVDARRGVMLGETELRAGPLPRDHRYGIWLEPEAGGESRDTIIRPSVQRPKSKQD